MKGGEGCYCHGMDGCGHRKLVLFSHSIAFRLELLKLGMLIGWKEQLLKWFHLVLIGTLKSAAMTDSSPFIMELCFA